MVELAGAGLARSVTNGICSSSSRANPRWVVSLESKTRCGGSVPCVCFQKSIEAKDLVGLLALPIALGSRQSPGTSRTRLPSLPRWARRRSRSPTCPGWRSGCAASAPFWPTIGAHCSAYCTTHPEHAPAARRVWARAARRSRPALRDRTRWYCAPICASAGTAKSRAPPRSRRRSEPNSNGTSSASPPRPSRRCTGDGEARWRPVLPVSGVSQQRLDTPACFEAQRLAVVEGQARRSDLVATAHANGHRPDDGAPVRAGGRRLEGSRDRGRRSAGAHVGTYSAGPPGGARAVGGALACHPTLQPLL